MSAVRCGCAFSLTLCGVVWGTLRGEPPGAAAAGGGAARAFLVWLRGGPWHSAPNVGVWWYLMCLAFGPDRPTFAFALHLLPRLCVPALATLALHSPCGEEEGGEEGGEEGEEEGGEDGAEGNTSTTSTLKPPLRPTTTLMPTTTLLRPPLPLPSPPPSPFLPYALCAAVLTATAQTPTLPDIALAVAFVLSQLDVHVLSRTSRLLPAALGALLVGGAASAPLLAAWVEQRQLNANFFYLATLAVGAGQLLFVYDVSAAVVDGSGF